MEQRGIPELLVLRVSLELPVQWERVVRLDRQVHLELADLLESMETLDYLEIPDPPVCLEQLERLVWWDCPDQQETPDTLE